MNWREEKVNFFPASGPKAHTLIVLQAAMVGVGVGYCYLSFFIPGQQIRTWEGQDTRREFTRAKYVGEKHLWPQGMRFCWEACGSALKGCTASVWTNHTLLATLLIRRKPEERLASGIGELNFPAPPNSLCSFSVLKAEVIKKKNLNIELTILTIFKWSVFTSLCSRSPGLNHHAKSKPVKQHHHIAPSPCPWQPPFCRTCCLYGCDQGSSHHFQYLLFGCSCH